jgi:predicted GIY-YIG superfamily endonuclease
MTNDLTRRIYEHKTKAVKGFTEKYNVNRLVYFEETSDVYAAISREKEFKKWRREKRTPWSSRSTRSGVTSALTSACPIVIPNLVPSRARDLARNLDAPRKQDFSLRSK